MENLITTTVRDALKELELNYQEDDGVFEFCIKIEHTKDKKMAMADDSMITVADIFESVELAIKNYS